MEPCFSRSARSSPVMRNPETTKKTRTPTDARNGAQTVAWMGNELVPTRWPKITSPMEMARSPSSDAMREFEDDSTPPSPPYDPHQRGFGRLLRQRLDL